MKSCRKGKYIGGGRNFDAEKYISLIWKRLRLNKVCYVCSLCKQEILPPCDLDFIGDVSNRPWLRGWRRSGEEVEEGEACSFRSSRLTNGADTHLCPALFAFSSFFSSYLSLFPFFLPRFTSFPTSMQSHVCLRASRPIHTKHLDFGFIHSRPALAFNLSRWNEKKNIYLIPHTIFELIFRARIFTTSRSQKKRKKGKEKKKNWLASFIPPRPNELNHQFVSRPEQNKISITRIFTKGWKCI